MGANMAIMDFIVKMAIMALPSMAKNMTYPLLSSNSITVLTAKFVFEVNKTGLIPSLLADQT